MLILGIETSCDETSVALVEDGRRVRANHIASQTGLHAPYGGVVPELASRAHIQRLVPMVDECLREAGLRLADLDALAVTLGPGLVGALLIGVETAKGLAFASGKPLIPVHHIAAHLYSPFVCGDGASYRMISVGDENVPDTETREQGRTGEGDAPLPAPPLRFPYLGLVVSGGHTSLVRVNAPDSFGLIGETVDDAAGEAFDKLAKLLNLGYPGGPVVDRVARGGDRARFAMPRPMLRGGNPDFSFSGLKTAALKVAREFGPEKLAAEPQLVADICASFQEAVVEVLLKKAGAALEANGLHELAIVGGVACNSRLREAVTEYLPGVHVVFPSPILCTDNAAMIAGLAFHRRERYTSCDLTLNAEAGLPLNF
ncbi:MAG: tRNA (adenosine(37)-N6)-threonylcarbamoyltransferase complex dimerization subunit type 1 TsaB [Candidatus Sumerlaeaceae bacterium]|nr:tRNA (adenosine(37)-N6)-threonylcarbamoyltransferase complex dimerization subunit type 1 TsaB [Candidatus Sumerlaeaceae bacterium]